MNTVTPVPNPSKGIAGAYQGDSLAVKVIIGFCGGLSIYNAIELIILIFFTFNRWRGLYFYSLLFSSAGCAIYAIGFTLKLLGVTPGAKEWLSVTFISVGWYCMVTGQSVVLWSRLHLLIDGRTVKGRRTLKWTKYMIIIDVFILHIPTTVLTYGSNGTIDVRMFIVSYNVMEKIQMCGFFLQECILSTLYIYHASKLLKNSIRKDSKSFFAQLLGINIIIIVMDIALLSTEAASQYMYETILKSVIYSVKLKLEFAILGQLMRFVSGRKENSQVYEDRWRNGSGNNSGVHSPRSRQGSTAKIHGNARADSKATLFDPIGNVSDVVALHKFQGHPSSPPLRNSNSNAALVGFDFGTGKTERSGRKRESLIRKENGITVTDDINITTVERKMDPSALENGSDDDSVERYIGIHGAV